MASFFEKPEALAKLAARNPVPVEWPAATGGTARKEGKRTAAGSRGDVWNCVKADNERFKYDAATGHLVEETSKLCVATAGCAAGAKLCIAECATGGAGMGWTFSEADGTIRPRGQDASCLQTASKTLDAAVFVGACATPPTQQMQWSKYTFGPGTGGSYAGPCVRTDKDGAGVCLRLAPSGAWELSPTGLRGKVAKDVTIEWTRLQIKADGTSVTAVVDGVASPAQSVAARGAGMVSINSGYNVAHFDNFEVASLATPTAAT